MELTTTAARATVMVALVFFLFAAPAAAVHLGHDVIHSGIDAAMDATHSFWHWVSVRWKVTVSRDLKILAYSTATFLPQKVGSFLVQVRTKVVAPVLRAAVVACLAMSVMLVTEAVYLNAVSLFVKLFRRTPEKRYKWEPLGEDAEVGTLDYPMVLVQIPMYNEREVYKLSIAAACGLAWPPDRIIIQVLDDSTDPEIKDLVELECRVWASKGLNINYEVRNNRTGYKAGALKEGMGRTYVQLCEFVAIFDADFQPESDFLMRTIPFLIHNPEIALVQARWDFVNSKECLMTRIQKISLDYHFKVEQEAGSTAYAFFGFNGTAGVWRISALDEAGGWKDRTTVEDMDLAVRASLKGWKFVYVNDVKVKSELPSAFKTYRNQQHRWTCGAANLFRKMGMDILRTKEVSLWKKLYVIYNFFFVRKVISHVLTFTFYCVVVPVSVIVPEVEVPIWGVFYVPTTISLLNTMRNPRSIHLMVFWILFENVMAMHRMRATIIGLLEIGGVNEWVVTEKVGNTKEKTEIEAPQNLLARIRGRVYLNEVGCGVFLLFCASYNIAYGNNHYYIYIYLQAITFFIMGFGFVGTRLSQP